MGAVNKNLKSILRGSFGAFAATLLARFLGLFRVMLEARVLGGGALASSWQLAFMIPNMFRRLFGEGALSQALIPMLTHTEAEMGIEEVRKQLSLVFTVLTALLSAITVITGLVALIAARLVVQEYVRDALLLLPLIMPYSIFICLVGVMTAVVNTRKVFFMASLNALTLNIVLIGLLFFGQKILLQSKENFLHMLAVGVLLSGVLQLVHLLYLLKKHDIFPLFQKSLRSAGSILHELFFLTLPGMIGGAASQLSFLVDRALACMVGEYAVPALNYTERLVYLPIGIVAMALSSVLMADMSRAAANRQFDLLTEDLSLGLRYVWFGCAPLAIFMIGYREPLIRLFFMHGNFTEANVAATADALLFYAMGIPAFCATKVILPAFYARKKMTLPLKISIACVILNIPLSILLMQSLKQGGIALATVISAACNNFLLLFFLRRENIRPAWSRVIATAARSTFCALAAAIPAYFYAPIAERLQFMAISALPDAVMLLVSGTFFAVTYMFLSFIFRAPEPGELFASLLARPRRSKEV